MIQLVTGRWIRRYKLFFLMGLLILIIQMVLGYLLPMLINTDDPTTVNKLIRQKPSLKDDPVRYEHQSNLVDDDDSIISNSNSYTRSKIGQHPVQDVAPKYINLDPSELKFTPVCDAVTKDAASAIGRADTVQCKQLIVNVSCAIQNGSFYATNLLNTCPNGNHIPNRPIGCYQDEKKYRLLSGYYMNFKTTNTPRKCIQMCLQSGFVYAGLQYSTECFCGNTEPAGSAKLADPKCNYKCSGDPKEICGGYFTLNVFETGISKFIPQIAELIPRDDERKVRIVFLLTLNGRALRQIHRLLKALYNREHFYYIHVDKRQNYLYRELLKLEPYADNIRLSRKRYSTIWGGASLLRMLLSSMNDLLTTMPWQWDYVINLSESDYLVKNVEQLVDFLTANRGRNFVKSHGREVQRFIQKQGLDKTFVECDTHMWRIGDRELPNGIQIDGGSDWIALSRDFVEYVAVPEHRDDLIRGLLTIFNHTLLPAESFFHTALRNSRFCDTYVDNNLHVTNWKRKLGCKCQYKHVVDWCGCSPNDFKPEDWPRLVATENKQLFFARKFEPVINQAIILKLEEWLKGPYPTDYVALSQYWQSLYNHNDPPSGSDKSILSIGNSLGRIGLKKNGLNDWSVGEILEITHYFDRDKYQGFLIRQQFHHSSIKELIELELWARPQQISEASLSSAVGRRIKHLEVSSDFDLKEQKPRNFGKLLGPHSEPIVVMRLAATSSETDTQTTATNLNLTVLWVNPAGHLIDAVDLMIDEPNSASIQHAKLSFVQPLLPGAWLARIVHKKSLIAQCHFLIVPIDGIDPNLNLAASALANSGPWKNILPSKDQVRDMEQKAIANLKRTGLDLLSWTDTLVMEYFIIKDVCLVDNRTNFKRTGDDVNFKQCLLSNWSSLSPDPKSDIYVSLKDTKR